MDKTEIYIKQCEKAEEIQAHVNRAVVDICSFWFCKEHNRLAFWDSELEDVYCFKDWDNFHRSDNFIWLPDQSQLQEMIGSFDDCFSLIDRWDATSSLDHDFPLAESFEQLWLCIVMKERFSKRWNGENWIKED